MIEARIVEATDKFSRNLGVRLGYNNLASNQLFGSNTKWVSAGSINQAAPYTSQFGTTGGLANVTGTHEHQHRRLADTGVPGGQQHQSAGDAHADGSTGRRSSRSCCSTARPPSS